MTETILILLAAGSIYFIPTIIASIMNVKANEKIYAFNMLTGWTVIGWFAALIWALSAPTKHQVRFNSLA